MIDTIDAPRFGGVVNIAGRDHTADMDSAQFGVTTTYAVGTPLEAAIQAIAVAAGVTKLALTPTGKTLGRNFTFEPGVSRWKAASDLATAYGYDLYFNATGYLVLREFLDPVASPLTFTFRTGPGGTLADFDKKTSGTRLYNEVVVTGKDPATGLPIVATAQNNNPASPTHIKKAGVPGGIGKRTYRYDSEFITTLAQATDVALKFLAVRALEDFEMNLTALVIPWLDPNTIIGIEDPNPAPGDPTRYLLSAFTIPWSLGASSVTAKRVTVVG